MNDKTGKSNVGSPRLGSFRQQGIPKYLQLRTALARQISGGEWEAGSQLPSEEKLVSMSGLSLGTVQRALRLLVEDGLLVRKQGLGTFVAVGSVPMNAPFYHCRFVDDESGELLTIYSKVLRRVKVDANGPWSAHIGGAEVQCIERVFSIANEFSIYVNLYFDPERLPMLVALPLEQLNGVNFKGVLSREFQLPVTRFSENLSVRFFPDSVCKAIKVPRRTSGGVMEIAAYDSGGEAVYFQELYIQPNSRRLLISP
jgi:GntR family transcriptional regulator